MSVQDGLLTISVKDDREWFEYVNFCSLSSKVTVYLPKTEYASLVINEDTGKINVPETAIGGKCKITTDTGNIRIEILDQL